MSLYLKEISGFMLNVTYVSPAISKGGFSCHPGDLSRKFHLCHGSCKSQKRSLRIKRKKGRRKGEGEKRERRAKGK